MAGRRALVVLARLSRGLDGALPAARRAQRSSDHNDPACALGSAEPFTGVGGLAGWCAAFTVARSQDRATCRRRVVAACRLARWLVWRVPLCHVSAAGSLFGAHVQR